MTKMKINKIVKSNIFQKDFEALKENNIINFGDKKIAVLYAPNGVGKTSFCKVLKGDGIFDIEQVTAQDTIRMSSEHFHIINDQNGRNIIQGTAKDFLLGDNIAREFELNDIIENETNNIFKSIIDKLKERGIEKISDKKIDIITNTRIKEFVKDLANRSSKGKNIKLDEFINVMDKLNVIQNTFEDNKLKFFVENFDGIIKAIKTINGITKTDNVEKIEEHADAIVLLEKYQNKEECVVCDNTIDSATLLMQKKTRKATIYSTLDESTKKIVDDILNKITENDPFEIKVNLLQAIEEGTPEKINNIKSLITEYENIYNKEIENIFADCIKGEFKLQVAELNNIRINQPEFSSEDLLYIEEIIENNIGKNIKVIRDTSNKLNLKLDDKDFLEAERDKLELSAGEQNFISLTFELLKAKNSRTEVIVIDDPISSFDSIYKNKLVYSLIKFLENKKQIILTHNTDVLRLLEVQYKDCFNLYLFNNFENQVNGFIPVNNTEKEMLLYIPKLTEHLRDIDINSDIKDMRMYLISLIPFMRGYANLTGINDIKNELTKCMHGYFNDTIDATNMFNKCFRQNITDNCIISAIDIINTDLNKTNKVIIDVEKYPLLNKTLYHSFIYLYLRLNVERKLVDKFNINTDRFDNLGNIIREAYKESNTDSIEKRKEKVKSKVFLTSKKTLLNEFNHFDGNMSLFQPAIDISDDILEKEKNEIIKFLNNIQ